MMKRTSIFAALVACLVMTGCKPKVQQQFGGPGVSTREAAEAEDSTSNANQEYLTLAKMFEMVEPGRKFESSAVEQLFASMQLPMQYSEQYTSDADWGGDSPAISYCFGDNVKYEEFNLVPTAGKYYGVHTNFFFDDSRKTGFMNRFAIITSDTHCHNNLMKDAEADGLKFKEDVDPNVYGKKGKLFQKPAAQGKGASENANYYIFDFSTPGRVDVEVGYDTGIDI